MELTGDSDKSSYCNDMEPRGKYTEEKMGYEEVEVNFILEVLLMQVRVPDAQ